MKRLKINLLRALLLALLPLGLMAQNFSGYNWYFGPKGLRFSRSDNTATLTNGLPTPAGTGGSAVANNSLNGDQLFYTDGNTIYDVSNNPMPNGTGLGADVNSNQSVVVANVPGADGKYYVIVRDAAGSVSYRIVDMTLAGNATTFPAPPLGDAETAANILPPILTGRSDAMTIVPHANGDSFWLITHENGSPNYTVTLVSPAGPSTSSTFSNIGVINDAANFTYNPSTNQIAVAPAEANRSVEIVNFDPATGQLTFDQTVVNSAVTSTEGISDVEWSADGNYLYVSRTGGGGVQADVLQYDLDQPTVSPVSILPQPNTIFRSYGLQIAPDSAIYHLYQATSGGPILMGKITDTDSVAALVTYAPRAFPGNQSFTSHQFSSFNQGDTVNLAVTFTANGLCANAPTGFFPTVTPGADSLRWDFGDGSGSSEWSPVYTYTNGGSYNVSVTAFLNGQTATSSQPISINNFDTQISLVSDTTACSCALPFPKIPTPPCSPMFSVKANVNNGNGGAPQLQWYGPGGPIPGATTATLSPDSAGYYYLVATVGGCSTYAGVNIKEYHVQDERANIWYFGNHAGLDFNPPGGTVPISNTAMNTPEGTSTISDRNGQVVFFTNGNSVWNRQNVRIATGIGGDSLSAQSALIIPVPDDETLYYIFTTKEVPNASGLYEVRYSLFDLKLNGGTGGLIQQNVLLFSKSTEKLTGNANWLIAHEYGNNSFRSYRISTDGISNPVISSIGSDHSIANVENGQGYMELGANDRIAVALSTPGTSNVVEVFDFVDSTGVVSNFRTADLKNPNGVVYGVELSQGGNKLFATLQGNAGSQIVEFAFDSLGIPHLKGPLVPPSTDKLGAIQTGPDGQVYVAVDGQSSLGTIQVQEDTTLVSTWMPNGAPLVPGTNSTLGLPNFIQHLADPAQQPSISITGDCVKDSVHFAGTATDPIDTYLWTVRLGATTITTSTQQEFAYLFTTPGVYDVTLAITGCLQTQFLTQSHELFDSPPDPTRSAVLCKDELVLDANPTNLPNFTYLWSTADTTKTITVNRQGIYRVTVTNAQGCFTNGTILAAENRPIVDLGSDMTICQNTALPPLDAQNPGATYVWTTPSGTSTTRTQAVNTSVPSPPVQEYEVIVTDPVTTCFVKDSVLITINPLPVISPLVANTIACGANNGTIDFNITNPAGSLFSYLITGPTAVNPASNLTTGPVPTITGLGMGTYGVTVTEQVTGCAVTNSVGVNSNYFSVSGAQLGICDPIVIRTQLAIVALAEPITYKVYNAAQPGVIVDQSNPNINAPGGIFNTGPSTGLPSNNQNYIVEVTIPSNGCVSSSPPIPINHNPKVATTLTPNLCANPITIASSASTASHTWTGLSITPGTDITPTMSITSPPPIGLQTYNLLLKQAGFCDLDTAITINIEPPITPNITQTDGCTDEVTVTATPNGNYLYRWFRNGTIDTNLAGTQATALAANDGQQYSVTLYSPITGCNFPSNNLIVQVDGELSVTLASTTPCEGSPFTITATTGNNKPATFAWALSGSPIAGQTAATLQDNRSGDYKVTATAATCNATADINIILAPVTPGLLNDKAFICPDPANPDPNTRSILLSPGADYATYDWFKDGVSLGVTTPTLEAGEAGLYSVNLLNSFACPSSDKTDVQIQCDPVIVGPNAFRPTSAVVGLGGDFVNQSFLLYTFFIDDEDFEVFIFNRWGEMIFQTNQREFRWNGGYNNNGSQQAPAGTYTYVVRYKSSYRPEKGIQEKRGGIVLLR